jgi:hypothetical protein
MHHMMDGMKLIRFGVIMEVEVFDQSMPDELL